MNMTALEKHLVLMLRQYAGAHAMNVSQVTNGNLLEMTRGMLSTVRATGCAEGEHIDAHNPRSETRQERMCARCGGRLPDDADPERGYGD